MPHFTRFGRSRDWLKGCNKSEQTQLQNTKEMESSNPHALLLNKLQAMFPAVHIASPSPGGSLSDSLDTMIRSLPRPGFRETFDTISSMKTIVDGQEMRIQINMMELEQPECVGLVRKQSRETECEYEQEHYDMGEWNWNNNLHFEESLHHQFGSFID